MEKMTPAPIGSQIAFVIKGVKIRATFAEESGNTIARIKQMLANAHLDQKPVVAST